MLFKENCSTSLSALAQEAVDLNVAGTIASSIQDETLVICVLGTSLLVCLYV